MTLTGSPGSFGFTRVCKRFREGRSDLADCSLFSTRLPVSITTPKQCVDFENRSVLCSVGAKSLSPVLRV